MNKTLNLTLALETYLATQTTFLSQQVWNNLVNIAATAVLDFGVEPTMDDCKYNAYAIALSPESYIFDKEIEISPGSQDEPNNVENETRVIGEMRRAARSYDERKGLTTRQYDMVETWADYVIVNLSIIKDLEAQGLTTDVSSEDLFKNAIQNRRDNMNRWKQREDENRLHRARKMQDAVRESRPNVSIL